MNSKFCLFQNRDLVPFYFCFLTKEELLSTRLVCKKWNEIITTSSTCWKDQTINFIHYDLAKLIRQLTNLQSCFPPIPNIYFSIRSELIVEEEEHGKEEYILLFKTFLSTLLKWKNKLTNLQICFTKYNHTLLLILLSYIPHFQLQDISFDFNDGNQRSQNNKILSLNIITSALQEQNLKSFELCTDFDQVHLNIDSLSSLKTISSSLTSLTLNAVRVKDKDLVPITECIHLKKLELSESFQNKQEFYYPFVYSTKEEQKSNIKGLSNYPIHLFPGYKLTKLEEIEVGGICAYLLPSFCSFFSSNQKEYPSLKKLVVEFPKRMSKTKHFSFFKDPTFQSITDLEICYSGEKNPLKSKFLSFFPALKRMKFQRSKFKEKDFLKYLVPKKKNSSPSGLEVLEVVNSVSYLFATFAFTNYTHEVLIDDTDFQYLSCFEQLKELCIEAHLLGPETLNRIANLKKLKKLRIIDCLELSGHFHLLLPLVSQLTKFIYEDKYQKNILTTKDQEIVELFKTRKE